MKNKVYLSIAIIIIVILIASIYYYNNRPVSASPEDLVSCKTIRDPGRGYGIVFFGSKEDSESYGDYLINSPPFYSYRNQLRLFYIDDYVPNCTYYKDVALYCYDKELIRKASSCPNDFIVVIKDDKDTLRSSAYMNVVSIISSSSKNVLLHEFAHVFANLADEYVPAVLPRTPKNCLSSCDQFSEVEDGCFKGCSDSEHYRSIEGGVMRTLSTSKYGVYNQKIISSYFSSSLSSLTGNDIKLTEECTNEKYVLLTGKVNNESFEVVKREEGNGCIGSNGRGQFSFTLLTEGTVPFKGSFNPQVIFTDLDESGELSGGSENYNGEFYIKVPYVEGMKTLIINNTVQNKIKEVNFDYDSRPCKV
jgi:hypothetical protein